ncbi:MAG: single-stranded DNA-binding protein [Candidatus Omnitrophica bacterium]|nr:single-stranded DNA-binding protein [Candidatus Omnitrophota bacterium]
MAEQNEVIDITKSLVKCLNKLQFSPPVSHVYNPLDYAQKSHFEYINLYGQGKRDVLLIGMNPGPWGMIQNGVPFGDYVMVQDWLKIDAPVGRPPGEHPKRPVLGFKNTRREISGKRLWGWAQEQFLNPEVFFQRFFVINYCPLAFFNESGQNLTPDKLRAGDRNPLIDVCDHALRQYVHYYQPRWVVGIGGFAESSARRALDRLDVIIGRIPHPSPANPVANQGWAEAAAKHFQDLGIEL